MPKYAPLERFLAAQSVSELTMTFEEIERVLEAPLPPSAYKHRPWWSNNETNSSMTRAWRNAGFKSADVDLVKRRLTFQRLGSGPRPYPVAPSLAPRVAERPPTVVSARGRHPLFGVLKGMISIARGVDLTAPADPQWGRKSQ
ncbi:MAG: DUF7662 domain-containing protein [Candidatus Binatia bacterium]